VALRVDETVEIVEIKARRGDTFSFSLNVNNSAGTAYSFTSCSAKFTVKKRLEDADASKIFQLTSPSGGITLSSGNILIVATAAQMDIAVGGYYYDLELTLASGAVQTWLFGPLAISYDVG